jgi:hypothetical protein
MADPRALDDPYLMVVELEAYLTFRLLASNEPPHYGHIPQDEIRAIKKDLVECIRRYEEKYPERKRPKCWENPNG